MSERRMFAKTIIDSDAFLDLGVMSQLLYFHLSMRADDEGFVNKPKAIMLMIGAKADDLKALCERKFIIAFDSGVVVIKHWMIHNFIRKDTFHETKYKFEKSCLYLDENKAYSTHPQEDVYETNPLQVRNESVTSPLRIRNETDTQVRIGKDKDSIKRDRFTPPTLEELTAYCNEKGYTFSPQNFISYYESNGWMVGRNHMKDWKSACSTWQSREKKQPQKKGPFISHNDDGIDLDELLKQNNAL